MEVKGYWKKFQSGGYYSASNPQVEIMVSNPTRITLKLHTSLGGPKMAIAIILAKCNEGRTELDSGKRPQVVGKSSFFLHHTVDLTIDVISGRYIAVCCLQKIGAIGSFNLSCISNSGVRSVRLLPDYTRYTKNGSWGKFNGGSHSLDNPQYLLKMKTRGKVSIKLIDNLARNSLYLFVVSAPRKAGRRRKKYDGKNDVIAQSPFLISKDVNTSVVLDPRDSPQGFLVVPCSGKIRTKFELILETYGSHEGSNFVSSFEELVEEKQNLKESDCLEILTKYFDEKEPPFLKSNPLKEMEEYCERNKCVFRDSKFPPNETSVNKNDGRNCKSFKNVEWKRPNEFLDNPKLYVDGVEINDIRQGELGDCWLCQAVATSSMKPGRISDLISPSSYSKYGFYVVKLYHEGEWRFILIDDYIPTRNNGFIFIKSQTLNELWVVLIEKAFAKIIGSYRSMSNRTLNFSLNKLTGGVTSTIFHEGGNPKTFWKEMIEYSRRGWLMGCTSFSGREFNGIVQNHAYSIMKVFDLGKNKLIKIRNTWGRKEWKGKWSDSDKKNWTNEMKSKLDFQNKDDGIFFICFSDYLQAYRSTTFCKIVNELYPFSYQVKGDWTKEFGGTHDKESQNPKIPLKIKERNTEIFCSLIRTSNWMKRNNNSILMHLVKGNFKSLEIPQSNKLKSSKFMFDKKVKFEYTFRETGLFHIVPCITKKTKEEFTILLQSNKEVVFGGNYIDPFPHVTKVKGKWNPCRGYVMWDNPKIKIFVKERTEIIILFKRTDNRRATGMLLTIVKPDQKEVHCQVQKDQMVTQSKYLMVKELSLNVVLEKSLKPYVLLPCLQSKFAGCYYSCEFKSNKSIRINIT